MFCHSARGEPQDHLPDGTEPGHPRPVGAWHSVRHADGETGGTEKRNRQISF